MDSSPHQKWVERLQLEIKKIIEPINITYEHFINKILEDQLSPNLEIVNHLRQNKVSQDKIIKAFNAANVLITLLNVPEIYVRTKVYDSLIKDIKSTLKTGLKKELNQTLNLPFPDFVITFEKRSGDKYSETFYSVFEKTEKYIYKDEEYPIYSIKEMWYDELEKDPLKVANEIIIIEPMFPRIYINCKNIMSCENSILANPFKNTNYSGLIYGTNSYDNMCQKTMRTCQNCPCYTIGHTSIEKEDLKINLGFKIESLYQTIPERSFDNLCKVMVMLKRFKNARIKTEYKQSKTKDILTPTNKQINTVYTKREGIIYLTEKSYRYVNTEKHRSLGYKRNSPREHYRREHYRKLKDGRIIHVNEAKIGSGNKKTIKYMLQE